MAVVQTAEDFITSEEWPYPNLLSVKIWKGFAQQLLRYAKKAKVSKVKVTCKGHP